MSSPAVTSLLSGLVKGFVEGKDTQTKEGILARKETRDAMLAYLGHMVNSPDVPAEHKQWAMAQIPQLAQHDITKKFPKGLGDLSTLPPVTLQRPPEQQNQTLPGNQPGNQPSLQAPVGPGAASATPPAAPQSVGRASNGTVNALGQAPSALTPPVGPAGAIASRPPLQTPVPPQGLLGQGPTPPLEQLAPGGAPHILTQSEKLGIASSVEQEEINRLQQQYPEKSKEDLAYFAQHGEFPKVQLHEIPPGGMLVDAQGKVIARNEEPKPGQKSGFSYERGPGGEVLVKDNKTGATLSDAEIAASPEAKAVYDTGQAAVDKAEKKTEAKENRQFSRQLTMEDKREEAALNKQVTGAAVKAAGQAKAMTDVLDTSETYMKKGEFTPRQDLALIVRAVRAMNPGTVRLPQKELDLELKAGSYGARFQRWYTTALTGTLPSDQRNDLMNVIREETTQTGTSAAENWQQAFAGRKPVPSYLSRFALKKPVGGGGGAAHPNTHQWSLKAWTDANPNGNAVAAKKAAQDAGYEVVP